MKRNTARNRKSRTYLYIFELLPRLIMIWIRQNMHQSLHCRSLHAERPAGTMANASLSRQKGKRNTAADTMGLMGFVCTMPDYGPGRFYNKHTGLRKTWVIVGDIKKNACGTTTKRNSPAAAIVSLPKANIYSFIWSTIGEMKKKRRKVPRITICICAISTPTRSPTHRFCVERRSNPTIY